MPVSKRYFKTEFIVGKWRVNGLVLIRLRGWKVNYVVIYAFQREWPNAWNCQKNCSKNFEKKSKSPHLLIIPHHDLIPTVKLTQISSLMFLSKLTSSLSSLYIHIYLPLAFTKCPYSPLLYPPFLYQPLSSLWRSSAFVRVYQLKLQHFHSKCLSTPLTPLHSPPATLPK